MNIQSILVNHMTEPLGFLLEHLRIEFTLEADHFEEVQKQLTLSVADQPVYQTEFLPYDNNFFEVDLDLLPRTRYDIKITIRTADQECISSSSFFETGKLSEPFQAQWIGNKDKEIQNTLFKKDITINKEVARARLYMTALGVYETLIDQEKIGNEFLAPGVNAYDQWTQLQTYDVTKALSLGQHELMISTADGWYKGPYGFIQGVKDIYGDQHRALAEYHIDYVDGTHEVITTDESWLTTTGKVTHSSIYYGEDRDDTLSIVNWKPVIILKESYDILSDRLSLPLIVKETLEVQEVLYTPAGETVLDFGQNHAGLFRFYNRTPKGTKIYLQVGEILQEGNFYRENLRSARAAFEYISDGEEKWVQPSFTYYGYRYMKVEGLDQLNPEDFKADVIYSDMRSTGEIETNNPKVNRLFQNIIWGQKGNFFDSPTDCPQRDERLGWTGDANVFSNTALYNMDVYAFYRKFLKDVSIEQQLNDGRAPMYAPSFGNKDGGGAIWGDATTFIPWNAYQVTGDASLLKEHYPSMKDWVDWITRNTGTENLWTHCFQFGDWLALDGENPAMPTGKTDEDFIASIYYHYSAHIVAETARLLGKTEEAKNYENLSQAIKHAIQAEYISANGRLTIDTQTAYALALAFELLPENQLERVARDLVTRLGKDDDHLKTGFVGTPYINQMLSLHGYHKLATTIFLHEDYPSWLYAVNLGATTVWERWNSVLPDGSMNPEGMNSLNHYSIGAVMEWAYKFVLGIRNPNQGFKEFDLAPEFDYRLNSVAGHYQSSCGKIAVSYRIETDEKHTITLTVDVPFGSTAHVTLPRSKGVLVSINDSSSHGGQFDLTAGHYEISYIPTQDYVERYAASTPVSTIMADEELVAQIDAIHPVLDFFRKDPGAVQGGLGKLSLAKLDEILPFITIPKEDLKKIESLLEQTIILNQRNK